MINSPCVSVCIIDPTTEVCSGCYRTIDEIENWRVMDEESKAKVLERIEREELGPE